MKLEFSDGIKTVLLEVEGPLTATELVEVLKGFMLVMGYSEECDLDRYTESGS